MTETIEAACVSCGKVQTLVMCEDCREVHPHMKTWSFEQIIAHFVCADIDRALTPTRSG